MPSVVCLFILDVLRCFPNLRQEGSIAALYASVSLERFLLILLNIREVST